MDLRNNDNVNHRFLISLLFVTALPSPFLSCFQTPDGSIEERREWRGGEGRRKEMDRSVGARIDRSFRMVFGGGCTRFRPPKAGEDSRWVLPGRGRGEGRNPRC